MNKYFTSLAGQFLSIISIIIIIAMSISGYFQYKDESKNINNSLLAHGKSLGELLASISIDPLLIYDDVTLNDFTEFTSQQKDIVFAVVVNTKKVALTHYLNLDNEYIKMIPGSKTAVDIQPILEQLHKNPNILFVESPIKFENKTIAYSWVGLDRVPYQEEALNTLKKIIFVTCCVGVFVGGAIFLLFRYKIFQPIDLLTQSTQNIAKFEFERPVVIKGKGELSLLADSFDMMRSHLRTMMESRNKVMDELSELNNSLEERVNERTRELQVLNSKIAHQAMHDPLTGLPNRLLIIDHLQKEISHAARDKSTLAVFMIDLNNFKDVNDTLGHPVGDGLLKDVASRLKKALRESDTVGRLGGDEFAVVIPHVKREEAMNVASKVLQQLLPSFTLDKHVMKIGASIGIAMYPEHGEDHTTLIRLADVAMYEAKKSNNYVCMYRPELDIYTHTRLALINDLHDALEGNQLELHYQPKVSLKEGKVLSVEALIRWQHPLNGWIPPSEFIALAENSDLINQISYWVLNNAFSQWREWQDQGINLQIAVNLSARNMVDPYLPKYISELNNNYQMIAGGIKAEITESTIMSNTETVMSIMAGDEMSKMQFSIDDFGTGYSSLSYLKKLTVNEVKIDKTFICDMDHDEDDECIVKSVIDLAHNLGHIVVAEGVETIEVLESLIEMECDEVQGYYFSKPVRSEELISVITSVEEKLNTFLKNNS